MKPKIQKSPYSSPWSVKIQITLFLWRLTWFWTCAWTPKYLNIWRLFILKLFGAKIYGIPFVHSTTKIKIPWHLDLKHRACLGENVVAYSLGEIEIGEGATVAQEVYLCTATHDFENPSLQLITSKISIDKNSFIGARALILPGVKIGHGSIVGAMSVVSKSIPPQEIWAGNPAKIVSNK